MRRVLGLTLAVLAAALIAFGLNIAFGDPYDIGRAGLVYIGAFFVVPGLAVGTGALLLLRTRPPQSK